MLTPQLSERFWSDVLESISPKLWLERQGGKHQAGLVTENPGWTYIMWPSCPSRGLSSLEERVAWRLATPSKTWLSYSMHGNELPAVTTGIHVSHYRKILVLSIYLRFRMPSHETPVHESVLVLKCEHAFLNIQI